MLNWLQITFEPTFECTLDCLPLLKIIIIEPYMDTGVTNECVLEFSAVTFYTKYWQIIILPRFKIKIETFFRCSIEPFPFLNFGTLAPKTTKTMQLKIENIGEFSLKYTITNMSMLLPKGFSKGGSIKGPNDDVSIKTTKKSVRPWENALNNILDNANNKLNLKLIL